VVSCELSVVDCNY